MNDDQSLRLAVLIDADNASRTAMRDIMAEITVYGTPTIKRIYGDWTTPNMATWKPILLENAITPIQQYSYTTGKNATDSAMIIDAMDILYTGECDGFVLVSSDSDFTRLATRLREAGKKVIGVGEKKTPNPFIVACDKFIYIEVIRAAAKTKSAQPPEPEQPEPAPQKAPAPAKQEPSAAPAESAKPAGKKRKKKSPPEAAAPAPAPEPEPAPVQEPPQQRVPRKVQDLIASAVDMIADEDGYAFMGELGNLLNRQQPDFDPRNYGFSKLTQLIKSLDRFEVDVRQTSNPHTKHVYLRDKRKK
ncbi:NYN domain-containing protein [uncultured Intestinimonas sp.]|uniref:NYN domain-containing protein n=1 Tax=uncultured Intestinimonas sp. TaxID=1689265 RepID=UPI0025FA813D|nr:NYN domain-containing protein [uncultured Intestinimonas sp.]